MTEDDENLANEMSINSTLEKQAFDKNNNMNKFKNKTNNSYKIKNGNDEEINPFKNDVLEKLTSMQKFQVI